MIRKLLVSVTLVGLLGLGTAWAGDISNCDHPSAYESAVNTYVLEDYEVGAKEDLQEIRRRIAWLAKLDALFQDSYGSLGVHFLAQPGDTLRPCTIDGVLAKTEHTIPPNGAAAFIDQRVYQEGEQIFVQSYLRFTRFNDKGERTAETVSVVLGEPLQFSEALPEQSLAFPPRQLSQWDLNTIEEGFRKASQIYPDPILDQRGEELPLSSDDPLPFLVTEFAAGRLDAHRREPLRIKARWLVALRLRVER